MSPPAKGLVMPSAWRASFRLVEYSISNLQQQYRWAIQVGNTGANEAMQMQEREGRGAR